MAGPEENCRFADIGLGRSGWPDARSGRVTCARYRRANAFRRVARCLASSRDLGAPRPPRMPSPKRRNDDRGACLRQTQTVGSRADRRRAAESHREQNGYPSSWQVDAVADDEWTSQRDAAESLGVSMGRIAFLVQARTLTPVNGPTGRAGVSKSSVNALASQRRRTGPIRRAWTLVSDSVRSVVRGV